KLSRIYQNSRREYQLYVKRSDFMSLEGLVDLVEDFENLLPEREPLRAAARPFVLGRPEERYQYLNYEREQQRRFEGATSLDRADGSERYHEFREDRNLSTQRRAERQPDQQGRYVHRCGVAGHFAHGC
ncbi:unnamed protein product, partial [Ceratitis capitata]